MPEDGIFLGLGYHYADIGNTLDQWASDDLDLNDLSDRETTLLHELDKDGGLYDLEPVKDASTEAKEVELSLRFSEGDNFKLHLG